MRKIQTRAAVLRHSLSNRPYSSSQPLSIELVQLTPPTKNEILVKIRAAGLCHSDLSVINGERPRPLPMVLGHEASGQVVEIGTDVTDFAIGDHVILTLPSCGHCRQCNTGRAVLCDEGIEANTQGSLLQGHRHLHDGKTAINHHLGVSAFADYAVVSTQSAIRIDKSIPFDIAAVFGCAVVTGVGAIINRGQVNAESSVLITGLGGIGLAALMGATAAKAHTIIATDINPDKLALAKSLGATHCILMQDEQPLEQLHALCPKGVDVAADFTGVAPALEFAFAATKRGGKTISAGLPHPNARISISPTQLVAEERELLGSYLGSNLPAQDITNYMKMYQSGVLPVEKLITHRLNFEEINIGFERLANGDCIRQLIIF